VKVGVEGGSGVVVERMVVIVVLVVGVPRVVVAWEGGCTKAPQNLS